MKYIVEITTDGMIYVLNVMKTGSGIQVILRLLPRQHERLSVLLMEGINDVCR
jgi:hypothetical protein